MDTIFCTKNEFTFHIRPDLTTVTDSSWLLIKVDVNLGRESRDFLNFVICERCYVKLFVLGCKMHIVSVIVITFAFELVFCAMCDSM